MNSVDYSCKHTSNHEMNDVLFPCEYFNYVRFLYMTTFKCIKYIFVHKLDDISLSLLNVK